MAYVPRRGDVVWLTFDPQAGHEEAGRRPALVVSPEVYNGKVGLAIFCPVTVQAKGFPFEGLVPRGMAIQGVVLTDQVKSLDWRARRAEFLCRLPPRTVSEAMNKLGTLISSR